MRILLLEDNKTLNETICLKLELKGYEVSAFTDGQEALENITEGFSCFVLDINVPNVDGIKILQQIRKFYEEVPVIIISATVELESIKKSYDFGCNDYLKKPFFIDELEIKIDRLCKVDDKRLGFDEDSYFDFKQSLLIVQKQEVKLTQKEALLLNILLQHKNTLVSYENIQNYVWEGEFASIDAIRTLVRRLKKHLHKPYIKALSNRGYIFNNTF